MYMHIYVCECVCVCEYSIIHSMMKSPTIDFKIIKYTVLLDFLNNRSGTTKNNCLFKTMK